MTIDIVTRLAQDHLNKMLPVDWRLLGDILRDEVAWGSRGEVNEPGSEVYRAIFDTLGDAQKFRRIAIRAGYDVSMVRVGDVSQYEGDDFIVEIHGRAT